MSAHQYPRLADTGRVTLAIVKGVLAVGFLVGLGAERRAYHVGRRKTDVNGK